MFSEVNGKLSSTFVFADFDEAIRRKFNPCAAGTAQGLSFMNADGRAQIRAAPSPVLHPLRLKKAAPPNRKDSNRQSQTPAQLNLENALHAYPPKIPRARQEK